MDSLEEKVSVFMDEQYYYYISEESSELHGSMKDLCCSENSSDDDDNDPSHRTSLYWESQFALLQEILERYQSSGSKLREEIRQIIKEVKVSDFCSCFKPNSSNCNTCLRRRVIAVLSDRGFNTNLCISKWGTTKKCPGGSHEYIELIASTPTRKKKVQFLIELEFKDQFQIAKAGEEYHKLVSCLPEFYIGKQEYLNAIVRVMCDAAKKSMKEKKIHMGPWRKSSFMLMKWSAFNQTRHWNKSLGRLPTCPPSPHTQPTEPEFMRISGPHTAVVVT